MNSPFLLLKAMRPTQWTKNALVLAALVFAAGDQTQQLDWANLLGTSVLAAFMFCLASSAIYLLIVLRDVEHDRVHPVKKFRPIASGKVSPAVARVTAVVLIGLSLGGAWWIRPDLSAVLGAYLVLQFFYVYLLKHIALVDLFVIAIGFVLRALAGAVAINVNISPWLLLCTLMLALFLALCKRRQELVQATDASPTTRPSLDGYSEKMLDQLIAMIGGSTIVTYSLYTQWPDTVEKYGSHKLGFTIPFVMFGLFRYIDLAYRHQRGERPEKVLLTDIPLLVTIALYGAVAIWVLATR